MYGTVPQQRRLYVQLIVPQQGRLYRGFATTAETVRTTHRATAGETVQGAVPQQERLTVCPTTTFETVQGSVPQQLNSALYHTMGEFTGCRTTTRETVQCTG